MKWGVFVRLIRAEDYVKNILIFAPVFFAGKISDSNVWPGLFVSFVSFCLISSSIYILNDYLDRDYDKFHILKKNRPQAAGIVNSKSSLLIAILFIILGEFLVYQLAKDLLGIYQIYIFQNILYSIFLKKIIFIDIIIIALGYVWRIYIGGQIANVPISHWLYGMTILMTLTLSLGKRYTDLKAMQSSEINYEQNMIFPYTNTLLENAIRTTLLLNMLLYIAYTIYPETVNRIGSRWYILTSIPVIFGLYHYSKLILLYKNPASPVQLLFSDKILIVCVVIWLVSVASFNYLQNV